MLRTAVAEAIENARLVTAPNQTRLEWPGEDLADIGHAVAVSAYELLTRPELPRVKHCAGCHRLFLDESKKAAAAGAAWPTAAPTPRCGATSPAAPPNATQDAMITCQRPRQPGPPAEPHDVAQWVYQDESSWTIEPDTSVLDATLSNPRTRAAMDLTDSYERNPTSKDVAAASGGVPVDGRRILAVNATARVRSVRSVS
jgi:hypothetical protein